MGTGPFRFASFTPDDEIVLERYDDCWDDLPPAKRIVFRVIPEVAARVTALINGEVQLITNIPPDQAASLGALAHSSGAPVAEPRSRGGIRPGCGCHAGSGSL